MRLSLLGWLVGWVLLPGASMAGCGRIGFHPLPVEDDAAVGVPEVDAGDCRTECENAHGTADCSTGTCVLACDAGFEDCNDEPGDGCEADLRGGDENACGDCDTFCDASEVCTSGRCVRSSCEPGLADCDADASASCETDLTTSVDHCGSCDRSCSDVHATPECADETCRIAECDTGYDDCDVDASTGCETELARDTEHCGACDDPCTNDHGDTACMAGSCVPSCSEGYDDCDGAPRNGCETPLDTVANCGMCGRACVGDGGAAVCVDGACGTDCDLSGTWALQVVAWVTWPENSFLEAETSPEAPYVMTLRVQASESEGGLALEFRECARTIPEFTAKIPNEDSQLTLPDGIFDADGLPSFPVTASIDGTGPGASLRVPAVAALLGISLDDPLDEDAWPEAHDDIPTADRADMDGDEKPGVTAVYEDDEDYEYPRVSPLVIPNPPRSEKVYLATRAVFSLDGALGSCSEAAGSADLSLLEARLYGCLIAGGDDEQCDRDETDLIDETVMDYVPGAATYTMHKVANGSDCKTVREAFP